MTLAINGGKPVRQIGIPYGRQSITEEDIEAVVKVLQSDYLTTGPVVERFEKALCDLTGAKYAVAISNGTSALHAACIAAGVSEGDEVIVSATSFAASANCVLYCGGTPVFADINSKTWNINPEEIRRKITKKTKAVIAVDFTGQAVELNEIKEICKENNLILIEDAAHSIGTVYDGQAVGSIADLTTFSFHPVKTITTGEGGAVLTNNASFYEKMLRFRSHGITRDSKLMTQCPYNGYNEQIELGYNYRMTDFQAALGLEQLKKLNQHKRRRAEITNYYNQRFEQIEEIDLQEEIIESDTCRHLYIIRLKLSQLKVDRDEIYRAINAENVGLQVHYMPIYQHPYYQNLGYENGICPQAEKLYKEIITIPLYSSMTDYDAETVVIAVKKVIEFYRK